MLALKIRHDNIGYITYMGSARAAAIPHLKLYVEAGDSHAALLLGHMYEVGEAASDGRRSSSDIEKAVKWYLRAARLGDIRAIWLFLNLRTVTNDGVAVSKSSTQCRETVRLLKMAAAAKDAGANVLLGRQFRDGGPCVHANRKLAAQYFLEAARLDPEVGGLFERFTRNMPDDDRAKIHPPFYRDSAKPTPQQALDAFLAAVPRLEKQ
jgi:TPR repeat protein